MAGSGQALFGRRCKVTVATPVATANNFKDTTSEVIEIDGGTGGLRIAFDIKKTLKKEPNTSELRIYNLSPETRAKLQKKGVKVLIEAGYKDTGIARIFSGDVRTVDHVREGADWVTRFQLGDGERAWQFARVSESFSPGTSKADVVRQLAERMGLEIGNVGKQVAEISGTFDQGFAASGSASRAFETVMRSVGYEWSIQDGALQLLRPGQTLDLPVPELTPTSGLIGSPEMGTPPKKGKPALLKFDALLTPVKPGSKVKIKSERYEGYVRVVSVNQIGDTHDRDWTTKMAGEVLR